MNNNTRNKMKAIGVIKRIMSVNLLVVFLITILLPGLTSVSYAYENESNTIRGNNSFIEYLMDRNDGRFVIRTLEGIPQKISDDNKKLLFERENDPETSFTTFRVNGEDYVFGNKYLGHSDYIDKSLTTSDGLYTQSQWAVDSIKVKQILEIIEDPEHPNVGNVRIRYEVTNESDTAKSVGSRIFLDTMLGDNDGSSFIVSGDTITNETQLSGDDVPDYYRSSDDDFAPKVIGYGFLKGWGEKTPDKVIFAHYNNLSKTKWDYTVDSGINFTTNNNIFEGADSSVAYYFNEENLNPNETRVYETFYGIGDFSHYNTESEYAVLVNAPDKLTVNADKTGYLEDEFIVTVTVDNTLPNSKNLTNVNIMMMKKDSAFSEVEGEDYSIQIPSILKNEIKTFEFKLSAKNAQSFISEAIRVDVTSDNNINPVTSLDYILIPAVGGELPNLRLEAIAPSTVYYQGYREFSIKGKGFNMLTNKGLWELYLIDASNKMLEIPDESISVVNDEKLSITIYEDTFSEATPVGDYRFKIVHSDKIIGTVVSPKDKPITFSSDKKYQSRPYGVLYVEKRNKDDNFTYHTAVVDSKDMLDEIKNSLESDNGVPDKYRDAQKDTSYGPVEEIVLDIVGDVSQLTEQDNSKYYTVKTNSQSAIINSVIQYKDGNKPLEIRKINGIITIEGDGTLQIVNNNEFWWTSFYTYIADGEDYEMNEIIEEDDESGKSNIVIDFFDPGKILTSLTKAFFDGFEVEIRSVILLNEGASFGGKVSVEVPYGAPVPEEEEEKTVQEKEAEEEDAMFEALSDLFLTDEEREAKTKKQNRSKAYLKISALLLTEDAIVDKIHELRENWSAPPSEKAEVIYDLILQSPELLLTIQAAIGGKEIEEEDDGDRKSVGVTIDVKKVIVGKKYGDDYIYDSIRFIGIDAEGEVKVTLPFGSKEDREEAEDNDETQGVVAKVAINTIEGEYSIEADVNMKLANAHAIISIVKVDDRLVPDHLELSGGFNPGVPIAPPFYINKLGGGVKNLAGQFGKKDSGPLTIILILGINFQPTFEGEFRTEITKNGFSLEGDLGFKNGGMKIFERVAIALQWSRPRYFEAEADVDLFDVISGNAYIFVGERKDGDAYKFYFEGRVEAGIRIPDDIWLVGGKEIGSAQLGVSTEKLWGNIEVIGIGVGITYVYGKGVNFASKDIENGLTYASLTDVRIPAFSMDRKLMSGDHRLIIGSNIRPINIFKSTYAHDNSKPYNSVVAGIEDNYMGDIINNFSGIYSNIYAGTINADFTYELIEKDNAILEYIYTGELPDITIKDPSGNPYILVENENYLLKTVSEENSESGLEEKHLFISIIEPENGLWTVQSDRDMEEVGVFEALSMPEFENISYTQNGEDINVNFTSKNNEEALVSLFMVNAENDSEAGYALSSNIDATLGSASVKLPEGAAEGTYRIRATIQHPDYGYDEIISTETITITDPYKPSDIDGLNVNCIGDGYLKATWNPIAEEGEIQYSVSVYNEVYENAYEKVSGFSDMLIEDSNIIVGGSYTGIDSQGNEVEYSLDVGNYYKIGVTPIKVRTVTDSDFESIHIGNETVSDATLIRLPQNPVVSISYEEEYTADGETKYFNTDSVNVQFNADQEVDTTVKVDGEYFATFRNMDSFLLPLEFIDGEHKVEFQCKNIFGDTASKTVYFVTDTTNPELLIDSPAISTISEDGIVLIKGMVESEATVYLGEEQLATSENGTFETNYTMFSNNLKETLTITAKDKAGNETVYVSEVIDGTIKPITTIKMNKEEQLYAGNSIDLSVTGIDEDGTEVVLNNSDMDFSIIKGESLANVSETGILTAYDSGSVIVSAQYALTDAYVLQDAIEIQIDSQIEYITIVPELSHLKIGQKVQLGVVGGSKYEEISIPNEYISFNIASGHEYATLDKNILTANEEGTVTIEAIYNGENNNKTAQMDIYITPQEDTGDGDTGDSGTGDGNTGDGGTGDSGTGDGNTGDSGTGDSGTGDSGTGDGGTGDSGTRETGTGKTNNDKIVTGNNAVGDFLEAKEIDIIDSVIETVWKNIIEKEKSLEIISLREVRHDLDTKISMHGIGEIKIPKGTIKGDDQFLLGVVKGIDSSVNTEKYNVVSDIVELTFRDNGGKLEKPIKVSFDIDKASVQNIEDLGIYYFNNYFQQWQYIGGEVNADMNKIEIELNHLSKYAVMENFTNDKFMDINNHFSNKYVKSLFALGIVHGEISGGYRYYSPNRSLTRAELVTLSVEVYEKLYPDAVKSVDLGTDVVWEDEDDIPIWAKEYVKKAFLYGLVAGYEINGKYYFMPNNPITRAEAFTIIGGNLDYNDTKINTKFSDDDSIPVWAKDYVYKLVNCNIVDGHSDGTIKAQNNITRGEIGKVLYNWIEYREIEQK